jgi:hypothetical protein
MNNYNNENNINKYLPTYILDNVLNFLLGINNKKLEDELSNQES